MSQHQSNCMLPPENVLNWLKNAKHRYQMCLDLAKQYEAPAKESSTNITTKNMQKVLSSRIKTLEKLIAKTNSDSLKKMYKNNLLNAQAELSELLERGQKILFEDLQVTYFQEKLNLNSVKDTMQSDYQLATFIEGLYGHKYVDDLKKLMLSLDIIGLKISEKDKTAWDNERRKTAILYKDLQNQIQQIKVQAKGLTEDSDNLMLDIAWNNWLNRSITREQNFTELHQNYKNLTKMVTIQLSHRFEAQRSNIAASGTKLIGHAEKIYNAQEKLFNNQRLIIDRIVKENLAVICTKSGITNIINEIEISQNLILSEEFFPNVGTKKAHIEEIAKILSKNLSDIFLVKSGINNNKGEFDLSFVEFLSPQEFRKIQANSDAWMEKNKNLWNVIKDVQAESELIMGEITKNQDLSLSAYFESWLKLEKLRDFLENTLLLLHSGIIYFAQNNNLGITQESSINKNRFNGLIEILATASAGGWSSGKLIDTLGPAGIAMTAFFALGIVSRVVIGIKGCHRKTLEIKKNEIDPGPVTEFKNLADIDI